MGEGAEVRTQANEPGAGVKDEASETAPVCPVGFCPVGIALSAVGASKPDAVAHLLSVGREFLLAAKAVLDQRADEVARETRLERIDVG